MNDVMKDLFKVRSLITMGIIGALIGAIFKGLLEADVLIPIVSVLLGYFFGDHKKKPIENGGKK